MNKVWKVIVPNFEDRVPVTKRRRAKYYKRDAAVALPVRYMKGLNSGKYKWDKNGCLTDDMNNRIIANPISAGTPRYWVINGQRIYDGTLHYAVRAKVARWVHEYLKEYIEPLPEINIPDGHHIRVWVDMYKEHTDSRWDVDNQWLWTKWFLDTLVDLGKIPDDSVEYIRSAGQITFIPSNERKLVFNIQLIRD
tara:strand:+ start:11415 stop:11996 length:582 start_codon:yes stop_codon:yes gene_type:complete